ncbi:hypothetical protein F511_09516 [Dorcoceras hygrometricum]|uniref:Uncharacterized protein n=1 Tax=Dorcoceras hygrometricum TaxID=472368 RepID=A0A2Z7BUT5_9LAMI|nr:hypothetical protein F511_09516 [Dorcoceras hygrometricum]
MRARADKKPSRKYDRKVLVAEESTKSWEDTDSESSSSSSSSSDSEQEEVHCLMADQTSDDELSHSFEEIKAKIISLKNSSIESSSEELEDIDSLNTELSKLMIENYLLRNESSELKAEVEKLTKEMSSWNQSARDLHKLQESQKSVYDRTGLGFSSSESNEGETSIQSQLVYDKFNNMSFVKSNVIYDFYESITFDDQNSPKLNDNGKAGIGFQRPENSKPSWLKNKLDKDKVKAGSKSFVPNQPRRNSRKAKSGWTKAQPRRDLSVRELNAKVDAVSTCLDDVRKDIEATKEAISHQLLDFQAQAQANHNILTGQLSELVNYINRGGNDKKGEGSSRGPQPPPDDQNRDSGGDTDRRIVERLITADSQRQRERSRGHSTGSYKGR